MVSSTASPLHYKHCFHHITDGLWLFYKGITPESTQVVCAKPHGGRGADIFTDGGEFGLQFCFTDTCTDRIALQFYNLILFVGSIAAFSYLAQRMALPVAKAIVR